MSYRPADRRLVSRREGEKGQPDALRGPRRQSGGDAGRDVGYPPQPSPPSVPRRWPGPEPAPRRARTTEARALGTTGRSGADRSKPVASGREMAARDARRRLPVGPAGAEVRTRPSSRGGSPGRLPVGSERGDPGSRGSLGVGCRPGGAKARTLDVALGAPDQTFSVTLLSSRWDRLQKGGRRLGGATLAQRGEARTAGVVAVLPADSEPRPMFASPAGVAAPRRGRAI